MKHLKHGTAVLAAIGALAFVGTASATTLTSPANTQLNAGAVIKAALIFGNNATLHNAFGPAIQCSQSKIEGKITNAGTLTTTASGEVTSLTFSSCGDCSVNTLKKGTLEVHTEGSTANGNGTLTGTGQEITTNCWTPTDPSMTIHCIWTTSNTDLGRIIGGTPGTFTALPLGSVIPRTGGTSGFLCGSSGKFTGPYQVFDPGSLIVD